jgi:hypothetical protein
LTVVSLSLVFGALGFAYSFLGLFEHVKITAVVTALDPFKSLTMEEIGGHFLFGFVVAIPYRNLKIAVLAGMMALTIDSDHLLNAIGFQIQGRIDHSIPFMILSSILMSLIANKFFCIIQRKNECSLSPEVVAAIPSSKYERKQQEERGRRGRRKNKNSLELRFISDDDINGSSPFSILLLFITMSAFLSHIAYDVFVDDKAKFPLLAPFSFNEFIIPRVFGLPIEAAAFLIILLVCIYYYSRYCK